MAKKTYFCTRAVKFDGDRYEAGEDIKLEKEDAEPLLTCGAVVTSAQWKKVQAAAAAAAEEDEDDGEEGADGDGNAQTGLEV